ncbi:MarR family winged helix-turn-helix transcriptional regulator [Psychromicrobium lacuslunae]|uniref:Transcriptional regulator n=1 Tax=Psychromicrobium lacuslunae TaxID=1618207 RepID=A0A0D4BXU9_9MICC|nr:MarR family winged helix-turn-helix transcriptional regulator [Psychromicrobium lacuslunae]AJT41282.1 transcriptional regulator [Psychromicrobium lacuslunae]
MNDVKLSVQSWESFFRAQVTVLRQLQTDPVFKKLSVREYDVLYTLSNCPTGWVRLNELNKHSLLTQPSISRLVERLEARGLIQRRVAEDDRRGVEVGLTKQGLELQKTVGREHARDIHCLFSSSLTEAEMRELIRLSNKLKATAKQRK